MFSNILVPTDGSKLSQKTLQKAMLLAQLTEAKLTVVHVYPEFIRSPYGSSGSSEDDLMRAHIAYNEAEAGNLFAGIENLARAAGVTIETVLVQGDEVYRQIIGLAKKRKCDLICMASHGLRGVAALVLGSETQKVLMHSTIPVLVLR